MNNYFNFLTILSKSLSKWKNYDLIYEKNLLVFESFILNYKKLLYLLGKNVNVFVKKWLN